MLLLEEIQVLSDGFPFFVMPRVFSSDISLVCLLKCPYSCFSVGLFLGLLFNIIVICPFMHRIVYHYHHRHVMPSPRISLTFSRHPPYHPLLPEGLQNYILYRHRASGRPALLVHVKGSTGVHHLWARPYFSISAQHLSFRKPSKTKKTWSISSSSRLAISADIPDFLSPPLPIVHCFRQVFRTISRVGTELLYIGSI